MSRIFITGGTGFIGTKVLNLLQEKQQWQCFVLTRKIRRDYNNIHFVLGDISNADEVDRIMAELRPDALLHLAWAVEDYNYSDSAENDDWTRYSLQLVKLFLKSGGKLVVGAGTCFEYGFERNVALREDICCMPDTNYGRAKLKCCKIINDLCIENNARFVWGRIFYPYGDGEISRKLISWARNKLLTGEKITCNTPENVVDYIHVYDVAQYFAQFVNNENISGIVNVCSGKGVKIRDLLGLLMQSCHVSCEVEFGSSKRTLFIVGNPEKAQKYGLKCLIDIKRGLDLYNKETENKVRG